jgi:pheromone a factor receptor
MPATYNTPLAYVLFGCWPIAISLVSATYGGKFASAFPQYRALIRIFLSSAFTLRAFLKRRKQFKDFISTGALTYNRYWRLAALATVDFFITLPFSTWWVIRNAVVFPVRPWISWADTHWGYSRVFQFAAVTYDGPTLAMLEMIRWSPVFCALVFFAFFGFAEEAKKNYRLFASTVTKRFGSTTSTQSTGIDSYANFISLPKTP